MKEIRQDESHQTLLKSFHWTVSQSLNHHRGFHTPQWVQDPLHGHHLPYCTDSSVMSCVSHCGFLGLCWSLICLDFLNLSPSLLSSTHSRFPISVNLYLHFLDYSWTHAEKWYFMCNENNISKIGNSNYWCYFYGLYRFVFHCPPSPHTARV